MSTWIRNLKNSFEHRQVLLLHGNVRDRYIDEHNRVDDNLTGLLTRLARESTLNFSEMIFYDPVGLERVIRAGQEPPPAVSPEGAAANPPAEQRVPPSRTLAKWLRQLTATDQNRCITIFYLDKLIARKPSYQDDEREILLRLQKLIENIRPNHRLILVALQEELIPSELYFNSPKTGVTLVPLPDKPARHSYLQHRLGREHPHGEFIADLTAGLFLRDLDNLTTAVSDNRQLTASDLRALVNKYRIGEQADYWGLLNVKKVRQATKWFIQEKGVKGQEEAIGRVQDMLVMARTGLSGMAGGTPTKPRGALFFAGPTGVGKTMVAKKLAEFLFGTEDAFLRFDMSEYMQDHSVVNLAGAPASFVGYERGGVLTNAVREKPFSVILFDEIEKAHPRILDIFLQILDEGRLTDNHGRPVFFTEAVIIFTSNLGCRARDSRGEPCMEKVAIDEINRSGASPVEKRAKVREHFSAVVRHFFRNEISRPELLGRIGETGIVPFNPIDNEEVMREIVQAHARRIEREFGEKYCGVGHRIAFESSAIEWLVAQQLREGGELGARGLTEAIEQRVVRPLAYRLLETEERGNAASRFRVAMVSDMLAVEQE